MYIPGKSFFFCLEGGVSGENNYVHIFFSNPDIDLPGLFYVLVHVAAYRVSLERGISVETLRPFFFSRSFGFILWLLFRSCACFINTVVVILVLYVRSTCLFCFF